MSCPNPTRAGWSASGSGWCRSRRTWAAPGQGLPGSKAYSYGAAVKFKSVIGIDLTIKREYTQSQSLLYKFTGKRKHKLCGNNDYPSMAGKLIDRFA